jgi:hypothetical protein
VLKIQKWGGIAALLQAAMSLAYLVILTTLQGGPGIFTSADRVFAATHAPGRIAFRLITLLFSLTIVVIAMALRDRLGQGSPNRARLMVVAASIGSAAFAMDAVISAYAGPALVNLAAQNLGGARTLSDALDVLLNGLSGTYVFMSGWMVVLAGWAAGSSAKLPRALGWLMLLAGVVSILHVLLQFAFVSIPAMAAGVLLLTLVWSAWLGIVLWGGEYIRGMSRLFGPRHRRRAAGWIHGVPVIPGLHDRASTLQSHRGDHTRLPSSALQA